MIKLLEGVRVTKQFRLEHEHYLKNLDTLSVYLCQEHDDDVLLKLMKLEFEGKQRFAHLERIMSRYNKLRYRREKKELLEAGL